MRALKNCKLGRLWKNRAESKIILCFCFTLLLLTSCAKEDEAVYKPFESSEKYIDVWRNQRLKPLDGNILLNPYSTGVFVLNKDASKIVKKILTYGTNNYFLFKFSLNNNLYSYMKTMHSQEAAEYFNAESIPTMLSSNFYILDENFNKIKNILGIIPSQSFTLQNFPLDVHDYIIMDENHYIVFTYYPSEEKSTGAKVVGIFIQEIKDGDIIWEWDSINFPCLRAKLGLDTASKFVQLNKAGDYEDYLHLNSIFIDPKDNNLILSIRSASAVMKIKRSLLDPSDGEIIWIFGGNNDEFGLADDEKFMFQHHATLLDDNETLLLFDNGSDQRPYTRIGEYKLDEVTKTIIGKNITVVKSPITSESYYAPFEGSVQKIDNRYFINYSGAWFQDRSFIVEYDISTSQVVMEIDTFKSGSGSYRAYKIR